MNRSESPVPELEDVPDLLEVDTEEGGQAEAKAGPSTSSVDPYDRPKVPITLLTGYLGAGKSTLLNYILTENHGYRIAVCMNDFGDTTDIEAKSLMMSGSDEDGPSQSMLSLPNGCLCCSVKDMGIAAIEEMVAAQREKIDWVLVELTGVADPGPIAKNFWENEEMGDLVLDSIICVVDSRNIHKQLSETRDGGEINEAQKQLAASDVILLNKTDLVSPEQVDAVESTVRGINPTLRVYRTTNSQIALRELFDLRAYTARPALPALSTTTKSSCCDGQTEHDGHAHAHTHGVHNTGITTTLIPLPALTAPQLAGLNDFLEQLLWKGLLPDGSGGPEVLRCKGFVKILDGREMVLQGVTDLFELKEVGGGKKSKENGATEDVEVEGKVVFIGRGVDGRLGEALRAHLRLEEVEA